VKKAQKNCEKSFAKIFDFFFEKIFKYVDSRVNKSETEDLVAEIFLRVTRNLKKYSPQKTPDFHRGFFELRTIWSTSV
jgi:DNA-directed RNA polymerase specialized sigma subunit, sigma24 homolog